jgi:hypothetical protein
VGAGRSAHSVAQLPDDFNAKHIIVSNNAKKLFVAKNLTLKFSCRPAASR